MPVSINNPNSIRHVTDSDNWGQSGFSTSSCLPTCTVALPAGMRGIDVSNRSMYYIRIFQEGKSEIQLVTGGTYTAAAGGTIQFTPKATYARASIGSASSGIQEAINDACGLPGSGYAANPNAHIVLPATGATSGALPVHGTIFAHCSRSLIEGNGTLLSCSTRDRCMFLGNQINSNYYGGLTVRGINFTSTVRADGCQIASTRRTSNVVTISTASACSTIQTGDTIVVDFTDNPAYWGIHGPVTVSGTSITYAYTGANIALASTPGVVAIENAAIEDNTMPGTIEDIKSSLTGGGRFNEFIVEDDDEAATIRNLDADGTQGLLCDGNHCGSYIYSANLGAPVIWLDKSNISPQCGGNGITVLNNNTVKITDSVIQGWGMWAENTQTILGNYGGTTSDNVYMEEGNGPCVHPYNPGGGSVFSSAGIIYNGGNNPLVISGGEQPASHVASFLYSSGGSTLYSYYIVGHDTTNGNYTFPLFAGHSSTSGTGTVTVQWPHVPPQTAGDTVTYDIIRIVAGTLAADTPTFPVPGACTGGSPTACGSVITSLSDATACAGGLVCTYTDTASASTSSYAIHNTTWTPLLPFWPANLLVAGGNGGVSPNQPVISSQDIPDAVSVAGTNAPGLIVQQSNFADQTNNGGIWKQIQAYGTNFAGAGATILDFSDPTSAVIQGRFNFIPETPIPGYNIPAQHLITLVNSQPNLALATPGYRPPASNSDTFIGLDKTAAAGSQGLAFGSPAAISNYIGNKGDNASYLERLTAAAKTFKVPVTTNRQIISRLPDGTPPFDVISRTPVPNLTTGGNPVLKFCGTSAACANTTLLNGTVVIGSVALNSGKATVTDLPFSNTSFICTTSDTTTAVNGSKMVEASTTSAVVTGLGADRIAYICGGN